MLRGRASLLAGLAAAALLGPVAGATSLRSLSVGDLATRADLVFEGRALAREVREDPGGALRTCVQFEVLEVLKGPPVASPLELCFSGGVSRSRLRLVEGLRVPATGERGVYFVARLGSQRVNPLLGWDQGRFRVSEGAEPEVMTADGRPVAGLEAAPGPPPRVPGGRVARGARLAAPGHRGMPPDAFKARLRQILAGAPR
jgi:hypothetical protein